MHPIDASPILQMLRGKRPAAVAWLAGAALLLVGYIVGSNLGLWDIAAGSGVYVCVGSMETCASPEEPVVGEFVTFALLFLGGLSLCLAAGLSFLGSRHRQR